MIDKDKIARLKSLCAEVTQLSPAVRRRHREAEGALVDAVVEVLPDLLALAERPASEEVEETANELTKVFGWLDADEQFTHAKTVRDAATLLRRLAPRQSEGWQDIASAPVHKTIILGKRGQKLRVTGRRLSAFGVWRHAHSNDNVCFEPDVWCNLPAPPESQP